MIRVGTAWRRGAGDGGVRIVSVCRHGQHFFPKYVDGHYTLANGGEMFVSRGLSRESTPLPRLFNPQEIMVVEHVCPRKGL